LNFSIGERVGLLSVLPDRGTIATMRIVRDLTDALGFSEEELLQSEITQDGTQLAWNPDKDPNKDIHVGEVGRTVMLDAIKDLDESGEVTSHILEVYERLESESTGTQIRAVKSDNP